MFHEHLDQIQVLVFRFQGTFWSEIKEIELEVYNYPLTSKYSQLKRLLGGWAPPDIPMSNE